MFVALVPPERAVEDLEAFLTPRQEAVPELRWTGVEQWHVTLAFMAQVAERHLDDLLERLARAAGRRTPFTVALAGGGAFPHPARARVLFAGLDPSDRVELDRLSTGARAAANRAGAAAEGGQLHPHVTLARLRQPREVTSLVRVMETYQGPSWAAEEIALVESHLGEGPRKRPRYDIVETFPLGGRLAERHEKNNRDTGA